MSEVKKLERLSQKQGKPLEKAYDKFGKSISLIFEIILRPLPLAKGEEEE